MAERKLLVIEDDADLVRGIQLLLAHPDVEIDTAANGLEAICKARRSRPDAIVLDVGLPIVDGFEVFRTIRADPALAATNVIVLSGQVHPAAFARARALGAFACVRKPLPSVDEFRATVLRALGVAEEPGEADAGLETASEAHAAPRPLRLAVVSADPETRAAVAAAAREVGGLDVEEHELGIPALHAMQDAPPDLAVIELRLPDLHGVSLLKLLRRLVGRARLPVIGIASAGPREGVAAALGAGFEAVLYQPLERAQLAREIEQAYLARIGAAELGSGRLFPGPRAA